MRKLFKREKYLSKIRGFYFENDLIKVITGIRRCGKSSLMEMISDELIEKGVDKNNIIYINLDKRGYKNIKTDIQLENLIDEKTKDIDGDKYLLIDEIQNVKDFEPVINAFREEGDYSIFITGSNSYLLSGELMTKLTGRYLEFELYPLTFDEYIEMKNFYNMNVDNNMLIELNEYIVHGGFPRALFFDNPQDKRKYISGLIDEIFKKDIKARVKIRKKETFDIVKNYIINNFGSTMSINNMLKGLRAANLNVTKETLSKYIKILIDAKILYECDRFDMKSKKSLSGEKKYYLADQSFYFSINTDNRINYGPSLENIVFLYAKSMGYSISVGRIGKLECDFILRDKNQNYSYVQIAYTILASIDTENREYKPLENIKDNYPKYVMTTDYLLQKRNGINHVNLIEFIKGKKEF
jgi:predicted AAA+ superfamily ATPase